ncbi:MAG: glycosyltransferase family 39 protein [Actinobacteria bacterium]|nr:glycosyltransferase family 39 protein [Actinomycetota bacterium]
MSKIRISVAETVSLTSAWPFVLAVFAFSRLLFMVAGAVAATTLPWAEPIATVLGPPGINYWAHWDGAWYSEIALYGYDYRGPMSTTLFPLFPMLLHFGTALGGGPDLWGVLISLVATPLSLYFIYRVAEKLKGVKAARASVLTFAFFPTAFFLNAVYTEALFMAFTTGSIWAAYVRRDLLLAGLLGALAAATRNFGVLLLIPLGYEWSRHRQEFGWRGIWQMGFVPIGLFGYMTFLWSRFGDPLIFVDAQSTYWRRPPIDLATALEMAWNKAQEGLIYLFDPATLFLDPEGGRAVLEAYNTVSFAFLILSIILVGIGFWVLPPGLSVYTFLVTLVPVLTPNPGIPLMGLPRYVLGAFPLFLILGYLLSHSRPALYLWLLVSGGLGIAFTALFVTWRWMV